MNPARAIAFATLLPLVASCSLLEGPTGSEVSRKIQEDNRELLTQLSEFDSSLASLLSTIDSITTSNDLLEPKFDQLKKDVRAVTKGVHTMQSENKSQRSLQNQYEAVWTKTLESYGDPDLRTKSQKRLQTVSAAFQKQDTAAQSMLTTASPLTGKLADIQKFLSADLSAQGVRTIRSNLDETKSTAKSTRTQIEKLTQEVNSSLKALGSEGTDSGSSPW